MAAHLTDKQKKKIIADRANGLSLRQLAAKYGTSRTTVQRVIAKDPATCQMVTAKKEQNTQEMLEYMDGQKGKAQELLTRIIEALGDPEKLKRANVRDLATAYGIIADKFIQTSPKANDEALRKAAEILGGINAVIK